MKKYAVVISKSASKEIIVLPKNYYKNIFNKSKLLEQDPRPQGCKKLKQQKRIFEDKN